MKQNAKPAKPSPDFPLFAHARGQWAKKISGKMHYFGRWEDPAGALSRFQGLFGDNGAAEALASSSVAPEATFRAQPDKTKPKRPDKTFPLFAHANGQWAKKIAGKMYYFGLWASPKAALEQYQNFGRTGQNQRTKAATLRTLCDLFMASKRAKHESGEMAWSTFDKYETECRRLLRILPPEYDIGALQPSHFEQLRNVLAKKIGPGSLCVSITRIRSLFKYALDQGMIDRPVKFGQGFSKPAPNVLRKLRNEKGSRLFTPSELQSLIAKATHPFRAMILLGINCGLGNRDCAALTFKSIDLDAAWLDYPRPKTGVIRWCPLWPETVQAIREARACRTPPKSSAHDKFVFMTKNGRPWFGIGMRDNAMAHASSRLIAKCGLSGQNLSFYALRHTFQTIAEGARDQKAVEFVMGHAPDSRDMSAVYREEMTRERLDRVTGYVREWLLDGAASLPSVTSQ